MSNRILGIDPGIGITGFGLINAESGQAKALDFGVVRTKVDAPIGERLKELYDSLVEVFEETKPEMVAIEKLFFSKNITTGIVVAEARGMYLSLDKERSAMEGAESAAAEAKNTLDLLSTAANLPKRYST